MQKWIPPGFGGGCHNPRKRNSMILLLWQENVRTVVGGESYGVIMPISSGTRYGAARGAPGFRSGGGLLSPIAVDCAARE